MRTHVISTLAPVIAVIAAVGGVGNAAFGQMVVTGTSPSVNALHVAREAPIAVTFDRPVDRATFAGDNFWVFSRWGGMVDGSISFSNDDRTVTFTPAAPLHAGDPVMVVMSRDLRGADGTPMRSAGHTLTFTTRAKPTTATFDPLAIISDRSPNNAQTRIYGGLACDLDRDGWLDITLVNEVSQDLRVFLNRADGSGLFQPFLTPPTPIPYESSPNEPADFNRDGFVDIITTSNATNELTIAMGNGDGTFDPPTIIAMPGYPRGNAILDFDADGDLDIAVANTSVNTISLLANNGSGAFAPPVNIPSGGDGPYGLVTADMNNDGVMDLVVGHVYSRTAVVLRGNGNGTFTFASSRSIGGATWVVATGDLNADSFMDIVTANSGSANASVLLGNGNGTLQAAVIKGVSGHTVGTELADYDGDGDLDWLVACFGGGRWHRYVNNGAGVMTEVQQFIAPNNPACSISADFDNDGDLDLALLDEIADVMLLYTNRGNEVCDPDVNADGNVDQDDIACLAQVVAGDPACSSADPDFNRDGNVDQDDVAALEQVVAGSECP
ncbi:MAG: FG-GAP-like repeat-containing protein [Planctomycetota bacterium]|nr:FG-GAP-like repeat-containing protein [Planctomycetota bacterium]